MFSAILYFCFLNDGSDYSDSGNNAHFSIIFFNNELLELVSQEKYPSLGANQRLVSILVIFTPEGEEQVLELLPL